MARRANDWYPTPAWATEILMKRLDNDDEHEYLTGVLEPCAGKGDIVKVLEKHFFNVWTVDIDPEMAKFNRPGYHRTEDTASPDYWSTPATIPYVITNPPFSKAQEIVSLAYQKTSRVLACLLRLSYLEPTEARGEWLSIYPPTNLIVLPRISFTGDGKTDSVTCAWVVWDKVGALKNQPPIEIVPKQALEALKEAA